MKSKIAALAIMLALCCSAAAQSYPTRTITMIVPFAAGGPTDLLGRLLAQRMGEILGQSVIVENVGGAGGMTGMKRLVDARPDGYTIGIGTVGTHAQNQWLYDHPAYNAMTDFTPVALIAEVPIVVFARKDLPVNNLKEFAAYAKKNQATMQFGSGGAGSASHLACVVLNSAIGTNITHVPYKGGEPAMQDVIAGRIDFGCDLISTVKPQIDSGSVKALAVLSEARTPVEPNLPTAAEQGINAQAYSWNAVFLPKGAPEDMVKKLNAAVLEAIKTPAFRERLEGLGAQVVSRDRATPEYLASFVKSEIAKWEGPIKTSGVKVQ
ncbi:MAG TPA: tripartite tricarboxylate transporter substrate-binding protein [Bradyrhizobium sp.]|nr:tripartite tricarboxylate transporter substrate-binding protein [Bradyrhizobium sp.]